MANASFNLFGLHLDASNQLPADLRDAAGNMVAAVERALYRETPGESVLLEGADLFCITSLLVAARDMLTAADKLEAAGGRIA